MFPFAAKMAGGIPPLSASASPGSVSGSNSGGSGSITTSSATVTPSGGLAPYTYSWSEDLGSANSPTAATTTFTYNPPASNTTYNGTAICTVTDAAGQTATASVSLSYVSTKRPPTAHVSPSSSSQSSPGGGTKTFNYTVVIDAMNDATTITSTSWVAVGITPSTGIFASGSGSSASFNVTVTSGQSKNGYVQFDVNSDAGLVSPAGSWTLTG